MDQLPVDVANRGEMAFHPWTISVRQLCAAARCWFIRLREQGETLLRLLTAGLLFFAAGLKYLHLATTPLLPDVPGWQRWFWIIQIEVEIFWSIWLLAGICSRFTRPASAVLFTIFAGFSAYQGAFGRDSCHCFGDVIKINPWLMLILDALIAGAFLVLHATAKIGHWRAGLPPRRLFAVMAASWLLLGAPIAIFSSGPKFTTISEDGEIAGNEHVVLLDPQKWIGQRFPLVKHIDGEQTFAHGRWRLLFVRPGCPFCEIALQQLLSNSLPKSKDGNSRWALVELPAVAENASAPALPPHDGIPLVRLDNTKNWLGNVPFTVLVADGFVVEWASALP